MRIISQTLFICIIAVSLALPSFAADTKEGGEAAGDDVVAVVNGEKIPRQELEQKVDFVKQRYASQGQQMGEDQLSTMKKDIVQSLVEKSLLYQKSQELGIQVDSEEVNSQLEQFKNQFPDEKQYEQQLSGLGYTEDSLRSEIEENIAIQELIEKEIASKISITDEDLKSYYEENQKEFETPESVKARHILIKADQEADKTEKQAAREKIQKIEKRVDEGESFSHLAKTESECPSSEKGGDLGFFSQGQMVKPFEEAAFSMEPGDVSDIVETRFGYHLIKVEDKKSASKKSFDEVRQGLEQRLKQQKIKEKMPDYVEDLKEAADIEINL